MVFRHAFIICKEIYNMSNVETCPKYQFIVYIDILGFHHKRKRGYTYGRIS